MKEKQRWIVGEVSKNWTDGEPIMPTGALCQQFELMLEVNRQRGYRLHSFQIHRVCHAGGMMNETLIAVFELEAEHR